MDTKKHIEALLFFAAKPLEIERLSKILNKNPEEIKTSLNQLENDLNNRGICLLKEGDKVALGTNPESSKYCQKLIKEELETNLGKAGLETLAIILYKSATSEKGGVSRPEIDYIRGVNSVFTLRNLMIRGLIERKINPEDKRSYIYKPTIQLLQFLGITKKEDLPDFNNIIKEIQEIENDTNSHQNY